MNRREERVDDMRCPKDGCDGYQTVVSGIVTTVCPLVPRDRVYMISPEMLHGAPAACPLMGDAG